MFYYIYKTTNIINGKYYIGCHSTSNMNDGYLGSGPLLKQAIKKNGRHNFKKEVLKTASSRSEMFEMESQMITSEIINDPNSYNLRAGGIGGFYPYAKYIGVPNFTKETALVYSKKGNARLAELLKNEEWKKEYSKKLSNSKKGLPGTFKGKSHSTETIELMKTSHQGKHDGEKNSQWGTCWVYSLELKISKKIKLDDLEYYLELGYLKGRKLKF